MNTKIAEPTHIYAQPTTTLMEHLRTVAFTVDQLMELNGGMEPAQIITDWRDDGNEPGEHNGWLTMILWPMVVRI